MSTDKPARLKNIQYIKLFFLVVFFVSFLIPCYKDNGYSFCCSSSEMYYGYKCFLYSFIAGIMAFKNNPFLSLIILVSGLWVPVILMIRKNRSLLYFLSALALVSTSTYWILNLTGSFDSELLAGYWTWYAANIGIYVCQVLKIQYR
ncbi:MAG: hypothetical protein JXB00_12620 [Bacteroidales bacterium]|nr:hypothetical protein [Bacteroidales bacterium]